MEVTKRAISELSTDTKILHNLLESKLIRENAEIVTYEELSQSINRDVTNQARSNLDTATRMVEREHGVLIETVFKVGKKLSKDFGGALLHTKKQIGRKVRKQTRRVNRAIATNGPLEPQELSVCCQQLSLLGAIELFTRPSAERKIEAATKSAELPTSKTLELFK